jgi:ketosteroid isomerase-like protein
MKTKATLIILFVTLCVAQTLAACGTAAPTAPVLELTTAPPVPTSAPNPITIVQSYYEALNVGEFDKMASFMAEDMVATYPGGRISGKQEVITANQDAIGAGLKFELSDLKDTDGRVTSCFKVFQKDALIDQGCTGVTIVRSGQIIFDGLAPDEPVYVVQRFYQALNAKDVETAMSWVAPAAVFANPTGKYMGQAEIRASLESQAKDGITFDLSNFRAEAGRVVMDYKVMQGGQLLDSGTDGLDIVQNGLILFDGTERTEKSSDPAAIAQNFYQAINAGDIEAAMILVADDVKCRGECYFTGKDLFRAYIQSGISRGDRIDISDLKVEGDKVTYNWRGYSKAGFFQAGGTESLQIKDGLIALLEGMAQ